MPPDAPPQTPTVPPPQAQRKILIIEDEIFIADLYARQLTKAGYLVKTVNDGTAG
ncbi:response regulator transcription factor, partial [Candidatus Daviesbacteria bacterium]|nr:response regulator transcription factor [Candidatus Daviesbacteria bacterium]